MRVTSLCLGKTGLVTPEVQPLLHYPQGILRREMSGATPCPQDEDRCDTGLKEMLFLSQGPVPMARSSEPLRPRVT